MSICIYPSANDGIIHVFQMWYFNKKPWFNGECRAARKNFHLAKRIHKKCQSSENKDNLKEMSKKYKHTIDKCIKGYKTDLRNHHYSRQH